MEKIIDQLLSADEAVIRYKTLRYVVGKEPGSPEVWQAQGQVRCSLLVQRLLQERDPHTGQIPAGAYQKWFGPHWVLVQLADLGYPPGDDSLLPLREQVLDWLLPAGKQGPAFRKKLVVDGRVRTCASQEGNALYALTALGLADERAEMLAQGLITWQWPDGGWNCDKTAVTVRSSFHETITPLRGLVYHARASGSPEARAAAERAADVFLRRRMFRRLSDGEIMNPQFLQPAYPPYWHYDVLFALKVMAEGGWIGDPRCQEALDWLESQRLPEGGFAAGAKYYTWLKNPVAGEKRASTRSLVDWSSGTTGGGMNPWVTVDALAVLKAAGRLG